MAGDLLTNGLKVNQILFTICLYYNYKGLCFSTVYVTVEESGFNQTTPVSAGLMVSPEKKTYFKNLCPFFIDNS